MEKPTSVERPRTASWLRLRVLAAGWIAWALVALAVPGRIAVVGWAVIAVLTLLAGWRMLTRPRA